MSTNKTRVANAFRAMKAIGISEDKVKPVLKSLLKLYDKEWDLIEEENYRALADAIFEKEETEVEDAMQEEAQATEEPVRPLKRLRRKYQDGQTSSLNRSNAVVTRLPLVKPKEEPDELPETHLVKLNGSKGNVDSPEPTAVKSQAVARQSLCKNKGKQPISPKALVIHERGDHSQPSGISRSQQNTQLGTEPISPSYPMRLRDRRKVSDSPQNPSREKRPVPESSSHVVICKEPNVEPGIVKSPNQKTAASHALITPKDEPVTDDMPLVEEVAPIAVILPDPSNGGDSSNRDVTVRNDNDPEPSIQQSASHPKIADDVATSPNEPTNNGKVAMISGECSSNIEIASSPSGEVKIHLSCDLALGRPDFHMPSLEVVLESVDRNCLKQYKNLDPSFSAINLMKEMCQSFLRLGTESNRELPETMDAATPTTDLLNKSSAEDALRARGQCFNSLNESLDIQSNGKVPLPIEPVSSPHCNGIDDGSQPNKMAGGDEGGISRQEQENCAEQTNNLSLVVTKKPLVVTPEMIRSLHDVVDIAKGQEKVIITLMNDVNDELLPPFYYIPQNAFFQNANVNFSLARLGKKSWCTCPEDCLSSAIPCACAHEAGGKYAYTSDGLVKEEFLKVCISMNRDPKNQFQFFCKECPLERSKCEDIIEPCKGHLMRKFIKECWWKCGCNKLCGNRVVQRGISHNLQVFMTPDGKGWGLRTLEDLPEGAFVCEYVGEVLTNAELFDRVLRSPKRNKYSYPVLLDADWSAKGVMKDEDALCLDATYYGNVSRFINHQCYDANLVEIPVEVETPDRHYYRLAFFTTREVKAMEELTWDYGIDFDDHEHPMKPFSCQCGSKFCRNIRRHSKC
ncbi:hypothetical protein RD792_009515 [Penstemon davidsonii]|uniref:Uncharacterized protein n=1 Tax=Penstemon davidsonii TaxID=160366 RepID=A0ABR0CZ79_9LAMI|nr:hypothetical protein RD792_009515 [Penstemon davidsonii]